MKNKAVWFLILWFIWAITKDLELLLGYRWTSDYFAYDNAALEPLFFMLSMAVLVLDAGALYFLYWPKKWGLKVVSSALIAGVAYNAVTIALGARNIEGMKSVYLEGRESSGLSEHADAMSTIFSAEGFIATFTISLCWYLLIGALLYKNRGYFLSNAIPKS